MRLFSSRSRHRSIYYLVIGLFCVYLIYLIYNLNADLEEETEITSCHLTSTIINELKELSVSIRDILDSLNLKYFLCYHTLYGAIKNNKPLPYHQSLDFCILNHQLINQDEAFIIRQFLNNKLSIRYSSKYGFYKVNPSGLSVNKVHAKLFVFEKDEHLKSYRRIGLKYRIKNPNECASIHCFPEHLIDDSPLPLIRFIEDEFTMPNDREEILKYLMPDDWWKLEEMPMKCRKL